MKRFFDFGKHVFTDVRNMVTGRNSLVEKLEDMVTVTAQHFVWDILQAEWIVGSDGTLGLRAGKIFLYYYKYSIPAVSFNDTGTRVVQDDEFGETIRPPKQEQTPCYVVLVDSGQLAAAEAWGKSDPTKVN